MLKSVPNKKKKKKKRGKDASETFDLVFCF